MKQPEPITIILKSNGQTFSIEGLPWDSDANEIKEQFSRLLVLAGFHPSVIDLAEGGKYDCVYVEPSDVL